VVPAEGNGDLQTLICVLAVRSKWGPGYILQNWMAAYLCYILQMNTLFPGWPIMVHDTHTRRRNDELYVAWLRRSTEKENTLGTW